MDVDITITVPLVNLIYDTESNLWDRANTAWSLKQGIMQIISEPNYRVVGYDAELNSVDINVSGYVEISD